MGDGFLLEGLRMNAGSRTKAAVETGRGGWEELTENVFVVNRLKETASWANSRVYRKIMLKNESTWQ